MNELVQMARGPVLTIDGGSDRRPLAFELTIASCTPLALFMPFVPFVLFVAKLPSPVSHLTSYVSRLTSPASPAIQHAVW